MITQISHKPNAILPQPVAFAERLPRLLAFHQVILHLITVVTERLPRLFAINNLTFQNIFVVDGANSIIALEKLPNPDLRTMMMWSWIYRIMVLRNVSGSKLLTIMHLAPLQAAPLVFKLGMPIGCISKEW